MIANARRVYPERFVHSVFAASGIHKFHQVWFTPSFHDFSNMWEVMVDPYTGRVLGQRQAVPVYEFTRENVVNTVYTLHLLMFVGETSYVVLGLSGIFLLLSLLLGLALWWPRLGGLVAAITVKTRTSLYRRFFDLHRVFGAYGFVVLGVVAFSGAYLSLPSQIGGLMGVDPLTPPIRVGPSANAQSLTRTISQVVQRAQQEVRDDARLKSVWMPSAETNAWRVTFSIPGYVGVSGGETILFLDDTSGEVVQSTQYASASAAKRLIDWQLPLHSGKVFGLPGRILICIAGFLPLALFVTGLFIWRRKRLSRLAGVRIPDPTRT